MHTHTHTPRRRASASAGNAVAHRHITIFEQGFDCTATEMYGPAERFVSVACQRLEKKINKFTLVYSAGRQQWKPNTGNAVSFATAAADCECVLHCAVCMYRQRARICMEINVAGALPNYDHNG